jgi:hypothetical protein
MLLFTDLCFSTENTTGLGEVREISKVPYTDRNDGEDCEDSEDECKDVVYYFIVGECICFVYTLFDYVIFLCSYREFGLIKVY